MMNRIDRSKIAGMNICYRFFSLEYFLDSMVRVGTQSIELWGGYPHQFIDDISYPSVAYVKKAIADRGLKLNCYTPEQLMYPYNIADRDPVIREKSVEFFRKGVYAARELGAEKMLMTSGWGYEDAPKEDAWKYSRESLRTIGEYARKLGVIIALENLQPTETNLIYTLPALKRMIDEIDLPETVKAMVDTVPMHLNKETIRDYLDAFGENLVHVHLVDGAPTGHMAWGDGNLPLDEDMRTLCDSGYGHTVTFELAHSDYLYNPEPAMKRSFERVKPYVK